MNAFVAVFRRELSAQRPMLLTAGALALLAVSAPWWPPFAHHNPVEARTAVAFALTVVGGPLLALLVGASLFSRDLADGRLGFYLARPISDRALWLGKLAAGSLVALAAMALFILLSVTGIASLLAVEPWPLFLVALAIAAVCVLLGHHIAIAARARSAWLLVDLIALLVIIPLVWETLTGLWRLGAHEAMTWDVVGFALLITAALCAAGFLALRAGRSDLGQTHRRQVVAFWPLACFATLGLVGYARWVAAATPEDLRVLSWLDPAPKGPWVAISGFAHGRGDYRPRFLLDTVSGRHLNIDSALRIPSSLDRELRNGRIVFSGDGRRAAWATQAGAQTRLAVVDLASGRQLVDDTLDTWASPLALDSTGDRLFYVAGGKLMARGTSQQETARELFRTPESRSGPASITVLSTGELAIGFQEPAATGGSAGSVYRLWRVNPANGASRAVPVATSDGFANATLSSDGTRLLLDRGVLPARLVDANNGAVLRELPFAHGWGRACLLGDGGVAAFFGRRGHYQLAVVDRDGRDRLHLDLSANRLGWLVGERRPGRLLFAKVGDGGVLGRWVAHEIDLTSGKEVTPADGELEIVSDGPGKYFLSSSGDLVAVDPATDASRIVLRGLRVATGAV